MAESDTTKGSIIHKEHIVEQDRPWANLPNELLCEIFSWIFAGDRIVFKFVCRSWKSVSTFQVPLKSITLTRSPYLMFPHKVLHPIYERCVGIDFRDTPKGEIRMAKSGWLLMTYEHGIFFFNPSTKGKVTLPDLPSQFSHSIYFSSPPTSTDCVVVVALGCGDYITICTFKYGEESWSFCEFSLNEEKFRFSSCNVVLCKGLYYFLGQGAKLLIHDPKRKEFYFHEAPEYISHQTNVPNALGRQYMLESDEKVLAVFVSRDGRWICTCCWNESEKTWETLSSLGNKMLFVSLALSFCERAIVNGTGNKIYFPRHVGDRCLFYSLSTNRYHTFEMGSSYESFLVSKSPPGASWYTTEEQLW